MASRRISGPIRGVTHQLSRKSLSTSFARSITTSTSSKASLSSITTSADNYTPVVPLEQQNVLATIHQWPSLEPLRIESFPGTHLNLPTRRDILHRAVVYEGDMTRMGTASTKTRYEIRGSAKKIRPQKGSGRARLGDKKSPMLRGGGVAFGPRPRDFSSELPKKVYDLAWRTALSYRYRKGELVIVDNAMEIESPSPLLMQHILKVHEKGRGRSLYVSLEERPLLEQALDELDRGRQALTWEDVDVKDLLELSRIVIERAALHNILTLHQEDLTHKRVQPWHKSMIKSSKPKDLESTIGWQEFRALMLAKPSEREALRPDVYESVAYNRWTHAETLPAGPEQLNLNISAYELLAEAKDLRLSQLPTITPLELEVDKLERRIPDLVRAQPDKAAELDLEMKDLKAKIADINLQQFLLPAQAAEHRADALRWRSDEQAADAQFEIAQDLRVDVQAAEDAFYEASRDAELQRVRVLTTQGDLAAAAKAQVAAEEWSAKLEELRTEQEEVDEVDEAVVEAVEEPAPEKK
ncbi:ribosomal protein L4 [Corynespora cassiicola Philippines]|uniref:Large ribosomal subunit protein uL4m n=1 Tax=Corynespora cassiicola Philippines TaxID=1448308 RepID=A0A2T2NMI0_CORCC|nr:ribosomal protein L4 [Corynespora cassiicola Philippines]